MPHSEFTEEPVEGLPEAPPEGEEVLWQGRPSALALARDALNLYWIAGYFALLAVWRVGASSADIPLTQALPLAVPFLLSGVVACGVLFVLALIMARTTMYTITSSRVAMRVGAALTVTLNLPFSKIESADLSLRNDGVGTIAFSTPDDTRLSFLVLWPHVRPWRLARTQPALRSIPNAQEAARIFAEAAETHVSRPQIAQVSGATAPVAAE